MSIVKALALALAVSIPAMPQGYYDTDRIVWYDSHDHEGKWHLGAVELVCLYADSCLISYAR